jgi:predicted metal-binding membrane protein
MQDAHDLTLEHGAFCTGCCWFLMALLFYGGVMNLLWNLGLALFVLPEKVAPDGHWVGRIMGIGLIVGGGGLLLLAA